MGDSWDIRCQKAMARHGRVLPIQVNVSDMFDGPPCKDCLYWCPVVEPAPETSWKKRREVYICCCHYDDMRPDFSCFTARNQAPQTQLEKHTRTPQEKGR